MRAFVSGVSVYGVVFWQAGFISAIVLLCGLEAANFASFLSLNLQNSLIAILTEISL